MGSFTRRLWIAVSLVLFFSVLVSAKKERNVLELTSREVEGLLQVFTYYTLSGRWVWMDGGRAANAECLLRNVRSCKN